MLAQSERTLIRYIELTDAGFFLQLVNSPGFIKYIGKRDLADVAAAQAYIQEAFIELRARRSFSYYLISDLQEMPLGIAGFLKKDYLQNPDFGFAFMPQFHQRGLAYESCQKVLSYGITEFGFKQLDAVTMPSNQASIALLVKLGFEYVDDVIEPEKDQHLRLYQLVTGS